MAPKRKFAEESDGEEEEPTSDCLSYLRKMPFNGEMRKKRTPRYPVENNAAAQVVPIEEVAVVEDHKGKQKSWVWTHMELIDYAGGDRTAKCNYCDMIWEHPVGYCTTSLSRHLTDDHAELLPKK